MWRCWGCWSSTDNWIYHCHFQECAVNFYHLLPWCLKHLLVDVLLFVGCLFFFPVQYLQSRNVHDKINTTEICENCNWDMDCGYLIEQCYWKTKLLCDLRLTSSSETSGSIQSVTLQEHICRSTLFSQLVPKKRRKYNFFQFSK